MCRRRTLSVGGGASAGRFATEAEWANTQRPGSPFRPGFGRPAPLLLLVPVVLVLLRTRVGIWGAAWTGAAVVAR